MSCVCCLWLIIPNYNPHNQSKQRSSFSFVKFDKFQMTFDAAFPVWPVPTWFGVWVEPNYTNFLIVETQLRFCKKKNVARGHHNLMMIPFFFSRSMFTSNLQFCTSVGSEGIQPGQILMFLNRRQFCQLSDCFCQFF